MDVRDLAVRAVAGAVAALGAAVAVGLGVAVVRAVAEEPAVVALALAATADVQEVDPVVVERARAVHGAGARPAGGGS